MVQVLIVWACLVGCHVVLSEMAVTLAPLALKA